MTHACLMGLLCLLNLGQQHKVGNEVKYTRLIYFPL